MRHPAQVNERYGELTVLHRIPDPDHHDSLWMCRCDCGIEVAVAGAYLRNGSKVRCGGKKHGPQTKHGGFGTPAYKSWQAARARCTNPNNNRYASYGGRGIKMCERWLNSFPNFLEDMGERPEDHTLDRIDVDKDYEPGNCRWATSYEQARNKRHVVMTSRSVELVHKFKDKLSQATIAKLLGINPLVVSRVIRGVVWA